MSKFAHYEIPWSELPFFLALARAKTLSAAARQLGTDRTTVGRRADVLESRLSRALFERIEGRFELTQFGRKTFAAAERAEQELLSLGLSATRERHPKGKVRLSLPEQFSLTMIETLVRFTQKNPDILLEHTATDRYASLKRYETDVALRLSRKAPPDLAATGLGYISFRLYGSAIAERDDNRYLTHPGADEISPRVAELFPNAEVVISVDGLGAMREYIAMGAGIGLLPTHLGDVDTRLEAISPPIHEREFQLWILCLPEQKSLYRIQTLTRFLKTELKAFPGLAPV